MTYHWTGGLNSLSKRINKHFNLYDAYNKLIRDTLRSASAVIKSQQVATVGGPGVIVEVDESKFDKSTRERPAHARQEQQREREEAERAALLRLGDRDHWFAGIYYYYYYYYLPYITFHKAPNNEINNKAKPTSASCCA